MPGTIIRAIRDAESCNPVFLIDEIDKMGADFRGDPASAMLEVLDPEQHSSFRDHYLDLPVRPLEGALHLHGEHARHDPGPLLDRMDVIQLSGYTYDGEARDRQALPGAEAAQGARPQALAHLDPRQDASPRDRRVHARGRRPEPRPRDRRALPQGGDADREGPQGEDQGRRGARARVARPAALLVRGPPADRRRRRRDRPRRTPRSAATCSSSRRPRIPGAAG